MTVGTSLHDVMEDLIALPDVYWKRTSAATWWPAVVAWAGLALRGLIGIRPRLIRILFIPTGLIIEGANANPLVAVWINEIDRISAGVGISIPAPGVSRSSAVPIRIRRH